MSSQLKVIAAAPGEATIILIGKAEHYGDNLTISFPQFSSIPSQKVIKQSVDNDDLLLTIDADSLGDVLEPDSPYQIKIPEIELIGMIIWPDIIGKRGVSRSVIDMSNPTSSVKTSVIQKEEKQDDVVSSTETPSISAQEDIENNPEELKEDKANERMSFIHDEPKRSSSLLLIASILGIFVIVGGAGGVFLYMKHHKTHPEVKKELLVKKEEPKKEQPKASDNKNNQSPITPPKIEPSFAETLQKMSVADVINKAPNTTMITQEGERRLEVKQYDDGVLLLENAASKGDTVAMLKLGLLYDPVNFKSGGAIPSPDMREAARYFQKAEQGGLKDATPPRTALKDWLTKQSEAGDEMASLTLKDFWK